VRSREDGRNDDRVSKERGDSKKDPEHRIRDYERRDEGGQSLGNEKLLATYRSGKHRLQRACSRSPTTE
jgi:hypothetical protein